MALFKVTVNGVKHIVEAPSKSTAGAWGGKQLFVEVEKATVADLKGVDLEKVPTALPGGDTASTSESDEAWDNKQLGADEKFVEVADSSHKDALEALSRHAPNVG